MGSSQKVRQAETLAQPPSSLMGKVMPWSLAISSGVLAEVVLVKSKVKRTEMRKIEMRRRY